MNQLLFLKMRNWQIAPVKALKKRLAQKLGIPRFRLRILQGNCPLDDNQTLIDDQTLDPYSCAACDPGVSAPWQGARWGHDSSMCGKWRQAFWAALEPATKSQCLGSRVRFKPLCAAAFARSLDCISLLIEAGAKNRPMDGQMMGQRLFT